MPEQGNRLVEWLQRIENALRRLAAIALRVADLRDRPQRDDGARATLLVELDDRRKRRAEARKAIAELLDAHPWQARLAKMIGGAECRPPELVALEGSAAALNTYVHQLKRGVADAEQRVAELDGRIGLAEQEQVRTRATLNQDLDFLHGLEPLYGIVLLSVAAPDQLPALTAALTPATEASAGSEATVTFRTPGSETLLKPQPVRAFVGECLDDGLVARERVGSPPSHRNSPVARQRPRQGRRENLGGGPCLGNRICISLRS